jgi:uncharacterized protein (TIGR02271 family)
MKATFTKGKVTLAAVVAASLAMTSGCSSTHKSSSTAANYTAPEYQETASTTTQTTTTTASTSQNTQELTPTGSQSSVIPLYQENLDVSKRTVDAGTVRVKKIVNTETVSQPVELRHDEIVIDRQPASDSGGAVSANAFQDQETVIHLTREEPVVEKRTSMSGQVVVKTKSASEQQNVQGQVRKEDVAVVKSGDTQNVTVGQGISSQPSGEAAGGAESPSGQASGQSQSGQSNGQSSDQWSGEYKSGQPRIGGQQPQPY